MGIDIGVIVRRADHAACKLGYADNGDASRLGSQHTPAPVEAPIAVIQLS